MLPSLFPLNDRAEHYCHESPGTISTRSFGLLASSGTALFIIGDIMYELSEGRRVSVPGEELNGQISGK